MPLLRKFSIIRGDGRPVPDLRGLGDALFDEIGQQRDLIGAGDAVDEITPKRDAEFAAGFFQAEEGVTALPAKVAARSA